MQGTITGLPLNFVYHLHLRILALCLIVVMSTNSASTPRQGTRRWGIYHTDREYAREMGDPLRTTVEAPTKEAAEEEAAVRLGFSDPWTHPVAAEQEKQAQQLDEQNASSSKNERMQTLAKNPCSTSQPTATQLHTAIEVLGMLRERITKRVADSVMLWGEELPGEGEAKSIEQNTHIQTIAGELEQWRNELVQQRRQHGAHHI
jgi:hypothetical protein